MADTFYTLKETADKLSKSENAIKDMVKNGELREYRDGSNVLFKTEDVDKLAIGDIDLLAEADETDLEIGPSETGEISLASSGGELNIDEDIFALSDTSSGTGVGPTGSSINILGETDTEFKISEDTKAETKGIKLTGGDSGPGEAKIDDDVSLDSFGSGSGLLDLSLQADDTSLGAEVLEDIYSPDGGAAGAPDLGEVAMPGGDVQGNATAAADEIFDAAPSDMLAAEPETQEIPVAAAAVAAPVAEPAVPAYTTGVAAYAVPQAIDPQSGVYSAVLIIGLFVMAFTTAIAVGGAKGVSGSLLKTFSEGMFIWYVAAGLMVLSLVVLGVGVLMTQPRAPKAPKAPKPAKAPKAPKVAKAKK
jgi:excisionase family DNA binding protein